MRAAVPGLFMALALPLADARSDRPNIVVFLADDQGWGDLSIHGNADLATPRIDSLAQQGVAFDRFFVCPVCAPTRAEFLTGRFAPRTGVRGVTRGEERLNADETTIAQVFRAAGYATGIFGKWHNGSQPPYHPNSRGFDEFYGFTSGHHAHYFDPELEHNDRIVKGKGYIADDLTNHAIAFIRQKRETPFFCYIPYCTPHSPMQVPDEFWDRHKNRNPAGHRDQRSDINHHRAALAMVENLDWNVGRVLMALKELGLSENTIVVYFSDNGPNGHRWNGGMRGIKGSVYDGGTRSPLHIRWPAKIKPGSRVERNTAAIDLLPTLAGLAGVPFQAAKPFDGRDLSLLLLGGKVDWDERMLFTLHVNGRRAKWGVRHGSFRYYHDGELHIVSNDPGQTTDISSSHSDQVALMKAAGEAFLREVEPKIVLPDPRPLPVGVAAVTQLPARDGRGEGGVKRSSIHPNSSFFTAWTGVEQRIVWDIEVATTGTYEAILHYTCPAGDEGSRVRLSFGGHSVAAAIAEPNNPPLLGSEQDRSPRSESYAKDFKPLPLGTLELTAGKGPLVLTAETVQGNTVADVRRLILVRRPGTK
jgi:arylsulfatase A-like enzyme